MPDLDEDHSYDTFLITQWRNEKGYDNQRLPPCPLWCNSNTDHPLHVYSNIQIEDPKSVSWSNKDALSSESMPLRRIMNYETGRSLKRSWPQFIKPAFAGTDWGKPRKTSMEIADLWTEIQNNDTRSTKSEGQVSNRIFLRVHQQALI